MSDNRKLTAFEHVFEKVNRLGYMFNIVTICRIEGNMDAEILRKALGMIQCRHPRLNSRIVGDLDSLCFQTEGTEKIPLRLVEMNPDRAWQEVALAELNEPIDASQVLMRGTFISDRTQNNFSYLVTTLHHAIADALSTVRLHQDILTYSQQLAQGDEISTIESLPVLPPIEQLLPSAPIQGKEKPSIDFETLKFEQVVPMELRRTGAIHRQLDATLTEKLIKRCRQEKTKVHGALSAAMLLAAVAKIKAGEKRDVWVNCRTTVNLRKRLDPVVSNENLAPMFSTINTFHTIKTNTSVWELARDVTQQLQACLERGEIFSAYTNYKQKTNTFIAKTDRAIATISIASVGNLDIPSIYGPWRLSEISCLPAIASYGGLLFGIFSTFQGKMFLNFPFSKPSLSDETMADIVDNFISVLTDGIEKDN